MCGIVGYTGFRDADKVVLDCLKRLEYRGYDSAGVAAVEKKLKVFKQTGEISELKKNIPSLEGTTAMGHTRWATQGAVSKKNAHPHTGCNEKIAVVHNGIIENFKQIREKLEEKNHSFSSNTDSEVIAHLIEDEYDGCLEEAVFKALKKIKGSYALVVICQDEPGKLVAARNESPLVIGVGDNENFFASDIPAVLKYTKRFIYLDDGEFCVLDKKSINVFNENYEKLDKEIHQIDWDISDAEKSGFPHFMLKEIFEQPDTVSKVLRGRISEIENEIEFPSAVEELLKDDFESIHIVACGTSLYAGLAGKYLLEKLVDIPVFVEYASEYRYFGLKDESSLMVAITQSGETADTLAALKEAKKTGCKTLAITNVIGSTATRICDGYILMQSGPEIGVAATKTFTSQILVLYLLALKISSQRDVVGSDDLFHKLSSLRKLPSYVRKVLENNEEILDVAREIKNTKTVFFIGRGVNYPLSLEGALKLKEISYIHAEGFPAGELKHGPFALLTENTPVVAIVSKNDETYDKMLANIGEVKARGPSVIAIAEEDDTEIEKHADMVVRYPSDSCIDSCISISVIVQLLAYHTADLLGCNIDKPRNLAKSVTVE
ncbi:MAG: glutamine--fructose-6-phosphate transaminase (isomerizing) [Candidatus Thermoplasmatota archaeon]